MPRLILAAALAAAFAPAALAQDASAPVVIRAPDSDSATTVRPEEASETARQGCNRARQVTS